jgi:uncharacterized protein
MKIDVLSLREGDNSLQFREGAPGLELDGLSVEFTSDIVVSLRLHKSGDEIIVRGVANGTLNEECSRCLGRYGRKFDVEFEIFCGKIGAHAGAQEAEEGESDAFMAYHDGKTLEIGPVVREAIVLSLPMKALCREDCKGLCPACGVNLNDVKCDCVVKKTNARWSILEKFEKKEEETEGGK